MTLFRFTLAFIILLFGVLTSPHIKTSGYVLHIIHWSLFTLPLICQCIPNLSARVYSLWLGIFMILQGSITPLIINNFKTLEPNYVNIINVKHGMPGIHGIQRITTDHKGFRVTKAINYSEKPSNSFRIFAIGGSTTEQIYLDDKRTWTHLLQAHLDAHSPYNIEVINTGVSGTRAEHHLATLQGIAPYEPDMAIFMMGLNDWNSHIHQHFGDTKRRSFYKQLRQALLFEKTMLARLILQFISPARPKQLAVPTEAFDTHYYDSQRNSLARPIQKTLTDNADTNISAKYLRAFEAIKHECKKQAIECLFVTQPNGYDLNAPKNYIEGFWMTPPNASYTLDLASMVHISSLYNQTLLEEAQKDNFPTCDVAKHIPANYHHMYDDCHFNTHGAAVVAKTLSQCIQLPQ